MPNRTTEREQFLADIIITAVEGGVNYWAQVSAYRWHSDVLEGGTAGAVANTTATLHDMEEGGEYVLTIDSIARAFTILKDATMQHDSRFGEEALHTKDGKRLYLSPSRRKAYLGASAANDAGELDADDCDNIVQIAALGTVVYG